MPQETPTVTARTNPTNTRVLGSKSRTHLKNTWANTPRATPPIAATEPSRRRSRRLNPEDAPVQSAGSNSTRILLFQQNIITQAAVDAKMANVYYNDNAYAWVPCKHLQGEKEDVRAEHDIKHVCAPVVHHETGETITSYKKLAHGPVMSKTLMTGFGKEFGNLAPGDDKTGTL